ncbi:DUF4129 domain-containing protein [Natronomonas sp. EA1]|uniref:DUF4129 domain-containing protein n=1 Tax=Natronomonas sp. EA1 TaxID=3421655 RepID=UPI003EC07ED9
MLRARFVVIALLGVAAIGGAAAVLDSVPTTDVKAHSPVGDAARPGGGGGDRTAPASGLVAEAQSGLFPGGGEGDSPTLATDRQVFGGSFDGVPVLGGEGSDSSPSKSVSGRPGSPQQREPNQQSAVSGGPAGGTSEVSDSSGGPPAGGDGGEPGDRGQNGGGGQAAAAGSGPGSGGGSGSGSGGGTGADSGSGEPSSGAENPVDELIEKLDVPDSLLVALLVGAAVIALGALLTGLHRAGVLRRPQFLRPVEANPAEGGHSNADPRGPHIPVDAGDNGVYDAWETLCLAANATGNSRTPTEIAADIVAEGYPESPVDRLTALFVRVRYGDVEVTPERESRASDALSDALR